MQQYCQKISKIICNGIISIVLGSSALAYGADSYPNASMKDNLLDFFHMNRCDPIHGNPSLVNCRHQSTYTGESTLDDNIEAISTASINFIDKDGKNNVKVFGKVVIAGKPYYFQAVAGNHVSLPTVTPLAEANSLVSHAFGPGLEGLDEDPETRDVQIENYGSFCEGKKCRGSETIPAAYTASIYAVDQQNGYKLNVYVHESVGNDVLTVASASSTCPKNQACAKFFGPLNFDASEPLNFTMLDILSRGSAKQNKLVTVAAMVVQSENKQVISGEIGTPDHHYCPFTLSNLDAGIDIKCGSLRYYVRNWNSSIQVLKLRDQYYNLDLELVMKPVR